MRGQFAHWYYNLAKVREVICVFQFFNAELDYFGQLFDLWLGYRLVVFLFFPWCDVLDLIYLNLRSLLLFLLFSGHELFGAAGPNRSLGLRGLSIISLVTLLGLLSRN